MVELLQAHIYEHSFVHKTFGFPVRVACSPHPIFLLGYEWSRVPLCVPKDFVFGPGATPPGYPTHVHTVNLLGTVMHGLIVVSTTVVMGRRTTKCSGTLGLARSI